jgi:DNA-binding transcriptional LysR family regulator
MPGIVPGTEWAAFYAGLAAAFGLSIDSRGPNFGLASLLETVAGSATVATLVGEQTHLSCPDGSGLRRIPIRDPVPVYPHALIWRPDNPHPALATLRAHLRTIKPIVPNASTWTPAWA